MVDISQYTGLITSEHADKPKFNAMVSAVAQCFVDQQNALGSFIPSFDLDEAVGDQLDTLGAWVGISRRVRTPLTGVYFSFDIAGVGFDQGVWQGPFDPSTGITVLDDETYRLLIRAKIGANHWDGTLASSAAILNLIFQGGTTPRHLTATNELFATADGIKGAFQLAVGGVPVYSNINVASIYRNDWQGNQLLYATARTNINPYSQTIGGTGWSRNNVTATQNAVLAPDGTTTMATLLATGTSNRAQLSAVLSVAASSVQTTQIWLSAGTTTNSGIQIKDSTLATTIASQNINWSAGVPSLGGSSGIIGTATIVPAANSTYLLTFSFNTGTFTGIVPYVIPDNTATGKSLNAWGLDIKAGGTASSYIVTSGTAVTITDYTVGSTGIVALGQKPITGAQLTWNGSGDAYPGGTQVFIEDHQDMSISFGVAGKLPSALFLALLSGGYIPIKPEGVRVRDYVTTSVDGDPIFGFDMMGGYVAGFDVGAWGTPI